MEFLNRFLPRWLNPTWCFILLLNSDESLQTHLCSLNEVLHFHLFQFKDMGLLHLNLCETSLSLSELV